MRIAVVGAGWLGTKLVKHFVEKNYHVIATTTSPEKAAFLKNFGAQAHVLDFQNLTNPEFLSTADVVFLSMPISKKTWMKSKRLLQRSIRAIQMLFELLWIAGRCTS